MRDAEAFNRRLISDLTAAGALPEQWRAAFVATPRHVFVPDVIWQDADGGGLVARHRGDDPAAWLQAAYADGPVITQVDDGTTPLDGLGRWTTSSISKPTIVAQMLARLSIEPGMRVLEVGTGTGWNAALLARMVGDHNVVTVEVDAEVAERARKALAEAGALPTVVTGDGAQGHPPRGPYDRVIATASAQTVPYAWVEQTRPGGVILTPWGTGYDNGALLRLTVDDTTAAYGPFIDNTVAFMWLRAQRAPRPEPPVNLSGAAESTTTLNPDEVAFDDYGATTHRVRQHGPRSLWTEIENAYQWWQETGSPRTGRFGLAVTCEGQFVYLNSPDNPVG